MSGQPVTRAFFDEPTNTVSYLVADPATTNQNNVDGFLNMLIAARDEKVARFVFASSSSVYGDCTDLPKTEDHI